MYHEEIIIAGFGGQGILFSGRLLAYCALLRGYEVSWIPSYGPEMRGGTCNCHVIISNEPVNSPVISKPSAIICMNLPSLLKYQNLVKPGGLVLFDNSANIDVKIRNDVKFMNICATEIAKKENLEANIIMLSKLIREISLCDFDTFSLAINNFVSYNRIEALNKNLKAAQIGYNY